MLLGQVLAIGTYSKVLSTFNVGTSTVTNVMCPKLISGLSGYIHMFKSQNQKEFGCIGAAVLLILSPKELI